MRLTTLKSPHLTGRRSSSNSTRCGTSSKKRRRLWIWKALDRDTGRLLDWECRRRDAATLKTLVARLAQWEVSFYGTDHWPVSAAVIPPERLVMSKARTDGIERNHCRQRQWFGRFK